MDLNKIKVRRSFIFTPGLNPDMFPKALASGADMVCIELEDGIAIKDKDQARKNTIEALKTLEIKNDVELVVRINLELMILYRILDNCKLIQNFYFFQPMFIF